MEEREIEWGMGEGHSCSPFLLTGKGLEVLLRGGKARQAKGEEGMEIILSVQKEGKEKRRHFLLKSAAGKGEREIGTN